MIGTDPNNGTGRGGRPAGRRPDLAERSLGLAIGRNAPAVLASYDGVTSRTCLTAPTTGEFACCVTTDGGKSWRRAAGTFPWPQPVDPAASLRPGGTPGRHSSGLADQQPGVAYALSADGGRTFTALPNGPGGAIIAVSDGYVSLGSQPKLSRDGATWVAAKIPYLVR